MIDVQDSKTFERHRRGLHTPVRLLISPTWKEINSCEVSLPIAVQALTADDVVQAELLVVAYVIAAWGK